MLRNFAKAVLVMLPWFTQGTQNPLNSKLSHFCGTNLVSLWYYVSSVSPSLILPSIPLSILLSPLVGING